MSDSLRSHGLHTVHEILQARILECVAFPFSRGPSQARDRTQVSRIAGGFFTIWDTVKQIIIEERVTIRSGSCAFEPQKTKMFGENSFNRMPTTETITHTISIPGNNAITIPNLRTRKSAHKGSGSRPRSHTHNLYILRRGVPKMFIHRWNFFKATFSINRNLKIWISSGKTSRLILLTSNPVTVALLDQKILS